MGSNRNGRLLINCQYTLINSIHGLRNLSTEGDEILILETRSYSKPESAQLGEQFLLVSDFFFLSSL